MLTKEGVRLGAILFTNRFAANGLKLKASKKEEIESKNV